MVCSGATPGRCARALRSFDSQARVLCLPEDPVPSGFSSSDVLIPLADEYDPMFPNDYEKVMKRHREERQRQREQERQKEIEEREKCAGAHGAAPSRATPPLALPTVTCEGLEMLAQRSHHLLQEEEGQARRRRSQRLLSFPGGRRRLRRR